MTASGAPVDARRAIARRIDQGQLADAVTLKAEFENVGAALGKTLLPAVTDTVGTLADGLGIILKVNEAALSGKVGHTLLLMCAVGLMFGIIGKSSRSDFASGHDRAGHGSGPGLESGEEPV